jgi:hypothetical protein
VRFLIASSMTEPYLLLRLRLDPSLYRLPVRSALRGVPAVCRGNGASPRVRFEYAQPDPSWDAELAAAVEHERQQQQAGAQAARQGEGSEDVAEEGWLPR